MQKSYIFHIFGDGKFREKVKKNLPKMHFGTIFWHGFLPKKKIFELMAQNSIFVYTSNLDVIPMGILEAMQQYVPVCIKKIPQFQEFFENEILFQNDEDFVKIINEIQKNSENNKKISLIDLSIPFVVLGKIFKNFSNNFERKFGNWVNNWQKINIQKYRFGGENLRKIGANHSPHSSHHFSPKWQINF